MIRLEDAQAEGEGVLQPLGRVANDGTSEDGVRSVTAKVVFPVRTKGEADEVSRFLAGAGKHYGNRDEIDDDEPGPTGKQGTYRVLEDDVRIVDLSFAGNSRNGKVFLSQAKAELKKVEFVGKKRAASVVLHLKFFGLSCEQVGSLAEGIGHQVTVSLDRTQGHLFVQPTNKIDIEQGMIVVTEANGEEVAGVCTVISGAGKVVINDFGVVYTVKEEDVNGTIALTTDEETSLEELFQRYQQAAKDNGFIPCTLSIVGALVQEYAAGDDVGDVGHESWLLTDAIVDEAADLDFAPEQQDVGRQAANA